MAGTETVVARGYASLSFLHSAAEHINGLDIPVHICHLGDFDPSGVNAGEKIEETLRQLAQEAEIHFARLAVTPEQIRAWDLPKRRCVGHISAELILDRLGQLFFLGSDFATTAVSVDRERDYSRSAQNVLRQSCTLNSII